MKGDFLSSKRGLQLAALVLAASVASRSSAEEASDPRLGMTILLKVLTYDRNFATRGSGEFTVLVVSEPDHATARDQIVTSLKTIKVVTVQNRPLKFVAAEFRDEASLAARANATKASAFLVAPGTTTAGVQAVAAVAQKNKIYSLAMDQALVEQHLALGVVANEGKPQIVINLPAAKAIGATFETSVLKMARLIQ